jgi:hypothetical protein
MFMTKRFAFFLFLLTLAVSQVRPVTGQSAGGTILGKVLYAGTPPKPGLLSMAKDPNCLKINAGKKTFEDKLVVGAGGMVKNVFVHLKTGVPRKNYPAPAQQISLDQKGCMYMPRVQGAVVGQTLKIVNSDQTLHNIHSMSPKYLLNIAQPVAGMTYDMALKSEEVMLLLKCEIHTWMEAYIGVVPHPYFAVTSATGTYEIKNVPPGKYTVQAWHDQLGAQTLEVQVSAGQTATADFTLIPGKASLDQGFEKELVLVDSLPSDTIRLVR